MRIAVGQMWFEANTFNPIPTTLDDFKLQGLYFGAEIPARLRQVGELGGFMAAAEADPDEITLVPTIRALALPGGPIDTSAFEYIRNHVLSGIRQAGRVDGVLLSLHGAMVTAGVDDSEGTLLAEIRDRPPISAPITQKSPGNTSIPTPAACVPQTFHYCLTNEFPDPSFRWTGNLSSNCKQRRKK